MKHSALSVIALILAAAALAVSLFGVLQPDPVDHSAEIAALREENARLQTQIDDLRSQMAVSIPEDSYCNLMVDEWADSESALTLTTAYAQAQVAGEIRKTELLLYCNGQLCSSIEITLEASGAAGGYEKTITDLSLAMPALGEDDCVEVYLQITLADGSVISAPGGSWYSGSDGLFAVMG